MTPQSLSITIGEVELPYLLYEGGEPTLILLHATGFLPWLWHPIAQALAPAFRVIAPYFCDHRDTDLEKGGLRWLTLAEDIHHLCEGLGIRRPVLAGHSMGASVLTLTEALFGPMARGLLLIEPIFFPQDYYHMAIHPDDHPLVGKSLRRRNLWHDPKEAKQYLKSKPLFAKWDEGMLDLYIRHGMQTAPTGDLELTCQPEKEAALFMGGIHDDPWPVLSKVACPVRILEGEKSGNRKFIDLKGAAEKFSNAAHQLVPGAGHLIPMEKPGLITRIIKDFCGEVMQGEPG